MGRKQKLDVFKFRNRRTPQVTRLTKDCYRFSKFTVKPSKVWIKAEKKTLSQIFLLRSLFSFVVSTANFCTTLKCLDDDQLFCARNVTNMKGFQSFTGFSVPPDTDNCHVREKMIFRVIGKSTILRRSFGARK